jgi:GT2 family glycosyltransferase
MSRAGSGQSQAMPLSQLKAPVLVADFELAEPLSRAAELRARLSTPDSHARLLVRLHGHPLGTVDVVSDRLDAGELSAIVWSEMAAAIQRHFETCHGRIVDAIPVAGFGRDGWDSCSWRAAMTGPIPSATIVINTCGASDSLVRAIKTALAQDYSDFRVVVVDNRPARSGVLALLAENFGEMQDIDYVSETTPGLGRARNAGLAASAGEIVAFTDDDVVLDPSWLGWLVAGFGASDRVACVTGLIVPLELEAPAQLLIDDFSGFSKGYERVIWDADGHRLDHPLYPYTVGIFGSGASAAFRRTTLVEFGGFDQHLGIGTPSIGGEDLDLFVRIVLGGKQIVYEPASLLRHAHRRDIRAFERQVRGYGTGLTAMLTKHVLSDQMTRWEVLRRIPAGVAYALSPRSPKNQRKPREFSLRLSLLEWAGMAYGPIGYLRSRMAG